MRSEVLDVRQFTFGVLKPLLGGDQPQPSLPAAPGVSLSLSAVQGAELAPAGPGTSVAFSVVLNLSQTLRTCVTLKTFQVPKISFSSQCDAQKKCLIQPFNISQLPDISSISGFRDGRKNYSGCISVSHCHTKTKSHTQALTQSTVVQT